MQALIITAYCFYLLIVFSIRIGKPFASWSFCLLLTVVSFYGAAYLTGVHTVDSTLFLLVAITLGALIYGIVWGQRTEKESPQSGHFYLQATNGRKIIFRNPFDNFLVYAGANSGKTKSIGKNLLSQYIQHSWAGFVYDFKDGDYSRTTFDLVRRFNYPYHVYHANFIDLSCSHRFNILKPSILQEESFFLQLLSDVLNAFMADSKQNEWYLGALGLFRGVGIRFFLDYPQICTLPHIVNYITSTPNDQLEAFLKARRESQALAAAYLAAAGSEKTQASIRATLGTYLSELSSNKKVQYVLSGDDFDFNLIDPQEPKLLIVANSYQLDSLLSPIVALMINVSTRHFTLANKVNFFYFLDELTTSKVSGLEKMLSVLREYKASFILLTQSMSKIEKLYGPHDLRSIESNCSNKFFGKTLDPRAAETYVNQFARKTEEKITKTRGHNSNDSTNNSVSVSKAKENRYDPAFFMQLKPGEFCGRATNSNVKEFHIQFKQYVPGTDEHIPVVRPVLNMDIDENYQRIMMEISELV